MAGQPAQPRRAARKRAAVWSSAVAAVACLLAFFAIGAAPDRGQTTRPSRAPTSDNGDAELRTAAAPAPRLAAQPATSGDVDDPPLEERAIRSKEKRATSGPSTRPARTGTGFNPTQVVTALGIVLALILVLRWLARRFFGVAGPERSTRAVQVLSRSPLSPRQQLVMIRVGRRLLVVADAGGQMNTLSEITDADEVAALLGQLQEDHADRAIKTFGNLFGKMRGNFERDPDAVGTPHEERDMVTDTVEEDGSADLRLRPAGSAARDRSEDRAVESTRRELSGLMDKVRMLSRQFKSP